jgi:NAD(P)-dependent dehydrogenase (short-subunit alcohol dehydrogenase family)
MTMRRERVLPPSSPLSSPSPRARSPAVVAVTVAADRTTHQTRPNTNNHQNQTDTNTQHKQFVKQLLQRDGTKVVAAVRSRGADFEKVVASAPAGRLIVAPLSDAGDEDAVKAWAASLPKQHGVTRLGTTILNAGVYGERGASVGEVTAEGMASVFRTNAIGPMLCVRYLREEGLIGGAAAGGGAKKEPQVIAAVSSKMGSMQDNGSGGAYAYRASKAALNAVFKSLSVDLKPEGVKAVLLHPGYVRTGMTGGQGLIDADQSARGMLALLENDLPAVGGWMDYKGDVVPW